MFGSLSKTVALAATPEVLSATPLKCSWATVQAKLTNTGTVQIFGPLVGSAGGYTIANPGDSFVIWSPASLHMAIDLGGVWARVSVNGEGVDVTFVK